MLVGAAERLLAGCDTRPISKPGKRACKHCRWARWIAPSYARWNALTGSPATSTRTLNSEDLMARPAEALAALATHFALSLDQAAIEAIVSGPAFTRNSKTGGNFSATDRAADKAA